MVEQDVSVVGEHLEYNIARGCLFLVPEEWLLSPRSDEPLFTTYLTRTVIPFIVPHSSVFSTSASVYNPSSLTSSTWIDFDTSTILKIDNQSQDLIPWRNDDSENNEVPVDHSLVTMTLNGGWQRTSQWQRWPCQQRY